MRILVFVTLALSTALAPPAMGQYRPMAAQAMSPADQLAAVMRRLAAAPTDLLALISAGELSVKVDDMSAAAAFFARADRIDPRNPRVKAGMAAILVRAERPGEALRYFQMAEKFGLDPTRFAADRGLAHDLLGEQERAQRDYRLALRTASDDETVRRYALSLGISGQRAEALRQLDPLVRRQDRAAWRVRAFVLAMNDDVAGATKIANTMMPAGMAGGLRPFFERLPSLAAADRAFAVHFGEVRPTPARLADARMKPALAPLGPDPYGPVQVAVTQAQPPVPPRGNARDTRRRDRRDRVQVAAAPVRRAVGRVAMPPVETPASGVSRPATTPVRTASAPARPTPPPVALASTTAVATPTSRPAERPVGVSSLTSAPTPVRVVAANAVPGVRYVPDQAPTRIASVAPAPAFSVIGPSVGSTGTTLGSTPPDANVAAAGRPVAPIAFVERSSAADLPTPGFSGLAAVAGPASPPVKVAAVTSTPAPAAPVTSEDSILARIVASISIPAEELGVTGPVRRAPVTVAAVNSPAARTIAAGMAKAARETADRAAAARTIAAAAKVKTSAEARATRRGARAGAVELAGTTTGRGKRGTVAADEDEVRPRTAAERRRADRKAAEEKLAAKTKPKEKGEPERIWVQVAGGSSEGDLPRAWSAAQKKASALKGRAAYTTPSRTTNRVVTGPFKTAAEARAFVNQLARQGVSAFQFTSPAGQKITKLSAR